MKSFGLLCCLCGIFLYGTIHTHRERITCRSSSLCHYHKKSVFCVVAISLHLHLSFVGSQFLLSLKPLASAKLLLSWLIGKLFFVPFVVF